MPRLSLPAFASILLLCTPWVPAQQPAGAVPKSDPSLAARLFQLPEELVLTEAQSTAIAGLIAEYEPVLAKLQAEILDLTTKQQREARAADYQYKRENSDTGNPPSTMDLTEAEQKAFSDIKHRKNAVKR